MINQNSLERSSSFRLFIIRGTLVSRRNNKIGVRKCVMYHVLIHKLFIHDLFSLYIVHVCVCMCVPNVR